MNYNSFYKFYKQIGFSLFNGRYVHNELLQFLIQFSVQNPSRVRSGVTLLKQQVVCS